MSEIKNGKILDLAALQQTGIDVFSLHPDFLEWFEKYGHKIKCRMMLDSLALSGISGEAAIVELNSLFAACPVTDPDFLHVSDTKVNGRFNVNARWRIRDKLREKKRGKQGNTDPLLGGNFYQFGSLTHEVVGKLFKRELPLSFVQPSFFDEGPIDKSYLQEIDYCLLELGKYPTNGETAEELVVLQRPMVDRLHDLLPLVFGSYLKTLREVEIPKVQYASSLFLRSWGYAALRYLREPEERVLFREITFPKVAVFDDGQKVASGKADGLWVDTIDGTSPSKEESLSLRELARHDIKTFDELIRLLGMCFEGKSLKLGIWELKSLGDKERGILQLKEVQSSPRPEDITQVTRYAALGNKHLLDNQNSSVRIGKMEIAYLLSQPPISFYETMDEEIMENFLQTLKSGHEVYKKRAHLRQRELYTLREIIKRFDGNNQLQQSLFSLLTEDTGQSV